MKYILDQCFSSFYPMSERFIYPQTTKHYLKTKRNINSLFKFKFKKEANISGRWTTVVFSAIHAFVIAIRRPYADGLTCFIADFMLNISLCYVTLQTLSICFVLVFQITDGVELIRRLLGVNLSSRRGVVTQTTTVLLRTTYRTVAADNSLKNLKR